MVWQYDKCGRITQEHQGFSSQYFDYDPAGRLFRTRMPDDNILTYLDKEYFENQYGKNNVEQGFGDYKETKDNINNNHAANQQANKSSNFDKHVVNENAVNSASNRFPSNPNDLTNALGVSPKVTTTQHGTTRMVWEPNSSTRIRYESYPVDEGIFNPRHHGEHYHIEVKPDNLTWNQAKRQNAIQKIKPEDYKPGHGTGFLPNERHPGK
ncbi:hypothetical protein [Gilliamella apicola]|uniref:HNH/Endo VII superfamily nuclease toxins domain-containing protein n=1 Tax=Gilliamella apicola TaxID=1196095 RepID=A0A2V4E0Q2_9GAMM|nr:hypothetical protein DKK79_10440 [Gilliamella apicola]